MDHDELGLHDGHVLADAAPWPGREGNETVRLLADRGGICPAIRVEDLGTVVVLGVLHQAKQVGTHQHALGDLERTDLDVFLGHSGEIASGRRPHPQHLVDEVVGEFHFLNSGKYTPRSS